MLHFNNIDLEVTRNLETKLGLISFHNWGKCLDLQSSNYWKMHLWTFSSPWHHLIISPLCKTSPINFSENACPLSVMESFFKKIGSPILYREDSMPLPHWKIMWGNVLKLLTYWALRKWGLETINFWRPHGRGWVSLEIWHVFPDFIVFKQ